MIPVTIFAGRDVAVQGLGLSGLAVARALQAGGAKPVLWDDKPAAREEAAAQGFAVSDLAASDWSRFAALVLAPGIPLTHPAPHWSVKRAHEAGVEVIGDIELFFRERKLKAAPGKVATRQLVRASTLADRGPRSMAGYSPNTSPGPSSRKLTTLPASE